MILLDTSFIDSVLLWILRAHLVIETHVEQVEDLRLDCPWPDLIAHCDQYPPLEQMDPMALTHTPFPILLLKCLAEWKQAVSR